MQQNEAVFKAIADPTRRAILGLLQERERSVGEVAEHFAISRPAVAKHLKVLHAGGLIQVEVQGRERINRLSAEPLQQVQEWVRRFERFWDGHLHKLKAAIEE